MTPSCAHQQSTGHAAGRRALQTRVQVRDGLDTLAALLRTQPHSQAHSREQQTPSTQPESSAPQATLIKAIV